MRSSFGESPAYGHPAESKDAAQLSLSMSPMTRPAFIQAVDVSTTMSIPVRRLPCLGV